MRIVMVGPFGFHPNKTMRSRAFNLARPLVRRGHQVQILMPPWQTPEESGKQWREAGVEIRYVSLNGGMGAITWRLLRHTMACQPDVVHCFKPKAYSGLALWWLWYFHRSRLRVALDTDDWEGWGGWNELAPYTRLQKRLFSWQERWGLRHCHVLTVASRTLESLAWSHGVPPQRVVYVPNGPGIEDKESDGLVPQELSSLVGRPTLLLYSRLFEFDTARMVSILEKVKETIPDLAVLVVGMGLYGTDAARFRQRLADSGLRKSIVDVGWVEADRLPAVLAAADVGVYLMEDTLLNRTKCPVKLADMLSIGLPVVAEAVGQVGEYVIHERTGLLRSNGDIDGIAADLIRLLRDESARERLGKGARAHMRQHFAWEQLSQRVEAAYLGHDP